MKTYKDLYLGDSIEALQVLAKINKAGTKKVNPEMLSAQTAAKLYRSSQMDLLDQEKTYILLVRFLLVFDQLVTRHKDSAYVRVYLDSDVRKAKAQLAEIEDSLAYRYEKNRKEKLLAKQSEEVPVKPPPIKDSSTVFNNVSMITCAELFSALMNKEFKILIMDCRPEADYQKSSVKNAICLNIPDSYIQLGLSAHKLGELLSLYSKQLWDIRDSFDAIVLLDWNTTSENFVTSKLKKLLTIITEWDFDRSYKEKPAILNGGYQEWKDIYPTLTTNPHVVYISTYDDLDELLDLDNIVYPTDAEPKAYVKEETVVLDDAQKLSPGEILQQEKELMLQNKKLSEELLHEQQLLHAIVSKIHNANEADLPKLKEEEVKKEQTIARLRDQESKLLEKKSELDESFDSVCLDPNAEKEVGIGVANRLNDINKLQIEHNEILEARKAAEAKRLHLLDQVRQAKKPTVSISGEPSDLRIDEMVQPKSKPIIDRRTKPVEISPQKLYIEGIYKIVENGLTGLRNIKNTCYMNSIIQCLRHIPVLMNFYCSGIFRKHITQHPPTLSNEFAKLIRFLWSNAYSIISPIEFYSKLISFESEFGLGQHEDCIQFLLSLLCHLSDDCRRDINEERNMPESTKAWFKQFDGKQSFFINNFYHQIRIDQPCTQCSYSGFKFEMENVLFLSVPKYDFHLQDITQEYFNTTPIEGYCCKKCKGPVLSKKTICCYPTILVLVLKRYMQEFSINKEANFKRNNAICYFPTENLRVGKCLYKLHAISLHQGTLDSGHYTAACLNPRNNTWYEFNDEDVSLLDISNRQVGVKAYTFFYCLKKGIKKCGDSVGDDLITMINNNLSFE